MKTNVHKLERVARIAIGAALLVFFYVDPSNYWLLLGFVPLLTGLIGWCPPYAMLGISTCPVPNARDKAA